MYTTFSSSSGRNDMPESSLLHLLFVVVTLQTVLYVVMVNYATPVALATIKSALSCCYLTVISKEVWSYTTFIFKKQKETIIFHTM